MAQEWNERYPYLKHMTAIDAKGGKGKGYTGGVIF